MEYTILDYEQIQKTFRFKENENKPNTRLTHRPGTKFKILPYTTKDNKIENFRGITGAFSREITSKKNPSFNKNSVFEKILSIVSHEEKNRTTLLNVIDEIFFDEDDELVIAHPQFFNYIVSDKKQSDIGKFLASIFSTEEARTKFANSYNYKPKNVLLKLLHDSLPHLEDADNGKDNYVNYIEHIRIQFEKDFLFLLQNEKLFMEHFQQLLQYYYFHYINQLILRLDNFFKETSDVIPLFYNLDWENRLQSRRSYEEGWKVVDSKLNKLFAHVNCLEMINCIQGKEEFMSYKQFDNYIRELDEHQREKLNEELVALIKEYKDRVPDVTWEEYKDKVPDVTSEEYKDPNKNCNEKLKATVKSLFYHIDFQFKHSMSRKNVPKEFSKGFHEFAKKTFLKQSGPLGYTLNLKQEYIIFLTKICIGENRKLALNDLFKEFEYRGVYLDRDSRRKLVELYEKLNLLEKKSDSGDAQYVKYIL
ncbi:DNA phosphorothioation-dependent restriction protein DptG [Priestia megaterium]|uniref:DNA phosphorothioation-dependent restriction protein DptG n=1 Tax=Priestia megaterium TaxID=1404 RepID=UPI003D1A353A